jgi:hypothetical protein
VEGCAVTLTMSDVGTGILSRSKLLGMTKDTIQLFAGTSGL